MFHVRNMFLKFWNETHVDYLCIISIGVKSCVYLPQSFKSQALLLHIKTHVAIPLTLRCTLYLQTIPKSTKRVLSECWQRKRFKHKAISQLTLSYSTCGIRYKSTIYVKFEEIKCDKKYIQGKHHSTYHYSTTTQLNDQTQNQSSRAKEKTW